MISCNYIASHHKKSCLPDISKMMSSFLLLIVFVIHSYGQDAAPHFSIEIDGKEFSDNALISSGNKLKYSSALTHKDSLDIYRISFHNTSGDTVTLRNFVPLGRDNNSVYITGKGDHPLSRTHLFLPGKIPLNVICPDNAWELGFCVKPLSGVQYAALSRRDISSIQRGQRRRFETILFPGGSVNYKIWQKTIEGEWQNALRFFFQEKKLFDVERFDDTLFEREDLKWIRHSYVIHLLMAWDKWLYDPVSKKNNLNAFEERGQKLYGGDDVIGIWPTWPSLGLDQRNQFDLFRDLPGGTAGLKMIRNELHNEFRTRLMVCYNPWDESTRTEGHLNGLANLIRETQADGVVLDTRGASSRELQEAADNVKAGVVMYSEGMAVPKDMSGIVAGRVHNALYYPPVLNLNKFIQPSFAIFRVAELYKEKIKREFATSFFNGYGTEINMFAPGQPEWLAQQYRYLGNTSRVLRENTSNFTVGKYTPLIPTLRDSIWVNEWQLGNKTLYSIYSIIPQGFSDLLFEVKPKGKTHFVDVWHHRLLEPIIKNGKWFLPVETNGFNANDLGTNNEGEVDAVVQFETYIDAIREGNHLIIKSSKGDSLRIWMGKPAYDKNYLTLKPGNHELKINQSFANFEGDIVIQLFSADELIDETIVNIPAGQPRRISVSEKSATPGNILNDMVAIPAGSFKFSTTNGDAFIPYPTEKEDSILKMPAFYMDKYPVTNAAFQKFMEASHYKPSDSNRFLMHWIGGKIPAGEENFPVTYISYEDAKAYAAWAGKRLPTEIEWQYAAQTEKLNDWPWKQTKPVTRKEEAVTETLKVIAVEGIDSTYCNLGNGRLYPVGKYKKGVNPYGLYDLVGSVWQLTNDLYTNGSYKFIILKGGSYFKPSSSWWYVQGGPRELHYRQQLLRVSQGFERNATVGFRCVKDR
jgi:iron(II)-dependent oxidoreductase